MNHHTIMQMMHNGHGNKTLYTTGISHCLVEYEYKVSNMNEKLQHVFLVLFDLQFCKGFMVHSHPPIPTHSISIPPYSHNIRLHPHPITAIVISLSRCCLFSVLTLLFGRLEGHTACKKVGCQFVVATINFGCSFGRLIPSVVTTISIIIISSKIQNVDILVPSNPGTTGKMTVKMYRVILAAKLLTFEVFHERIE